ncbi:MAG: hypothetical protein K6G60_09410 [Lachnospiraceae bacterium]|nr:hypothetical protein [Lachnospiraceae bacterium]
MAMTDYPRQIGDNSLQERIKQEHIPTICGLLDGKIKYSSSALQENYFKTMKNTYLYQERDTAEKRYWINNGLVERKSFQEVIDSIKSE